MINPKTKNKKKREKLFKFLKVFISLFIGLGLLYAVLWYGGIDEVVDALSKANLLYLALGMGLWVLLNYVLSIRIKGILEFLGSKISYQESFLSHMAGVLASDITPARVGYFSTAFLFKKEHKIPISKGIMALFGPQLFEFLWKVIISFALFIVLIKTVAPNDYQLTLFIIFGLLAGIGLIFLLFAITSKRFINKLRFLERIPGINHGYKLLVSLNEHGHVLIKKWKLIWFTILTVWILKGMEWFLILHALNITLFANPIAEILFLGCFQSFVFFLQFIPLPTVAGTGFTEGISTGILVLFGISLPLAVAFSILTRLIPLVVDIPLGMIKITHVGFDVIASSQGEVLKK